MRQLLLAAAGAAALSMGSAAYAAHELPPGDFGSPISTNPITLGTLLADTGIQTISNSSATVNLDTQLRAAVYSGPGYLDFVYQITNLQTSNTSVTGLSFANFAGFDLSSPGAGVWQVLGPIGVFTAGTEAGDSARRNFDGQVVGINFDTQLFGDVDAGANPLLNPGETSSTFVFRVLGVDSFTAGTFTAQNGVTVTGVGYSPLAAVPEPGTWAMMLLGFGATGFALRRSRRRNGQALAQIA